MFFREYFTSIMENLDVQFKGMERKGQNPSDKGELCEIFLKNWLDDIFSDQFKVFRGGQIIDVDERTSSQIDIVLLTKNTPKIFGDKGVYPIESVFGTFSITSNLNHTKLLDVVDEFKSIPKTNPRFKFVKVPPIPPDWEKNIVEGWNKLWPFKCAFGFKGDINETWEKELNEMAANNADLKNSLPDLIVVNKRGMIKKVPEKPAKILGGGTIEKDFLYTSFKFADCASAIATIINELYSLSPWQYVISPSYHEYFNKDFITKSIN